MRWPTRIVLTVLVTLLAVVVAGAQRGATPEPMVRENVLVKIGAHTWVIPDGNVPVVPNVGIIVGSRATLVIDPGMGRRNGEIVRREVARVSTNTELYVASTHYHTEHTTGALGLPNARYINSKTQEDDVAMHGAALNKMFASRSPFMAELLKGAVHRKADVIFDREHVLDLGGVRIRMRVVGPTHTVGDTVFFVEEDRVLFAGDVVMNESFVVAMPDTSMKAWLAAFDVLESWKPEHIVPSHGPIGGGGLIAMNRAFMREIDARVRALKAEGRGADEIATMAQKEMSAKHPTWARAQGVAAAASAAYREAP